MTTTYRPPYTAYAQRWGGGWELSIYADDGALIGVTQARKLDTCHSQARAYLSTLIDEEAGRARLIVMAGQIEWPEPQATRSPRHARGESTTTGLPRL